LLANLVSYGQNFITGERVLEIIDTNYKSIDNVRQAAERHRCVSPGIFDDGLILMYSSLIYVWRTRPLFLVGLNCYYCWIYEIEVKFKSYTLPTVTKVRCTYFVSMMDIRSGAKFQW
jgi:hypothetical protein